jgi:dTDP-4-amino-4,6-dideoxygalactose transaminase
MNSPPTIPFAQPDIGDEEIAAVVDVLRSGWLTSGPKVAELERDFAAFVGGGVEAVAVSSATAGLEVALAALGIGPGNEVITTTFTFTATAEAIVRRGATPVLVDIEPATFNIDPQRIADAVTPRTRAIIPVHFAGLPCDLSALTKIADRHGLALIEDAAHALPARRAGRTIGAGTSDATVFSFYANKTITTGEGGIITFRDSTSAQKARLIRLHGIGCDSYRREIGDVDRWRYEVIEDGIKANLSDVLAAIGVEQLRKAWTFHAKRSELWERYDQGLAGLPLVPPPDATGNDLHAYHLYAVRIAPEARLSRNMLAARLASAGIQTAVHFIPLHHHRRWRDALRLEASDFPNAEEAFARELTLPLSSRLTFAAQQRVIAEMHSLLN